VADESVAGDTVQSMQKVMVDGGLKELAGHITRVPGHFATTEDAYQGAAEYVVDDGEVAAPIEMIGTFVVPPPDGPPSRDFQTLHFDFGVPLVPVVPAEVARLTALHVPASASSAQASTRFVGLRPLVSGHAWPGLDELVRRFVAYGHSHGAWQPDLGYAEGSLARIIEAALDQPPVLPSVCADPDFLCGTEFSTIDDETLFFAERALCIDAVTVEVRLQPGELLLFDNLAVAHGRRGTRAPGELHQWVFGHRALDPSEQIKLRNRVLAAFTD
jgi:hypothetical protein